jgi:hypothetical protein
MIDVSIPCLADLRASSTTHTAFLSGLYVSSSTSACSVMCSNRSSIPIPLIQDISTTGTSPPHSSGTSQYVPIFAFISSCLFAPGLSIFEIATIIGTHDSLAWLMDSTVCGMIQSSAATITTTMSVSFAPLDLIVVNNSCPGVSINVI